MERWEKKVKTDLTSRPMHGYTLHLVALLGVEENNMTRKGMTECFDSSKGDVHIDMRIIDAHSDS